MRRGSLSLYGIFQAKMVEIINNTMFVVGTGEPGVSYNAKYFKDWVHMRESEKPPCSI